MLICYIQPIMTHISGTNFAGTDKEKEKNALVNISLQQALTHKSTDTHKHTSKPTDILTNTNTLHYTCQFT